MPTSVRPSTLDHRHAPSRAARAPWRGSSGCARSACGSVCDRVAREKSSKRSRSTTVRPTRPAARIRRVTRSTSPTSDGVDGVGRSSAQRPSARCEPIEPRRRPTCTGRGSRLWASAWRCRPDARPSIETSAASASRATSPTVVIPRSCSLPRGHRPDAPEPLDRQRVEEGELAVGRHHQQAVGLGHAARHLGEELRPRDADRDRQADPLAHVAPQPRRDLGGRARDALAARGRRGTPRRSTAPRPAASCRRTPRTPPCSPRSRPTCAARRRSPAGTAGGPAAPPIAVRTPQALRLVAGREHDPAADDHRPAAQARVVSLLDRRVERVEVGVQDRRLA